MKPGECPSTNRVRESRRESASRTHQGQRPSRRTKARMYGCNLNPSAASREEPGKVGGVHVRTYPVVESGQRHESKRTLRFAAERYPSPRQHGARVTIISAPSGLGRIGKLRNSFLAISAQLSLIALQTLFQRLASLA